MFKAALETSTCIKAARHSSGKIDSPFRFRHDTDLYQYYHQNPLKGARFAHAMAGIAQYMPSISRPSLHLLLVADKCHPYFSGPSFRSGTSTKLRNGYLWTSLGEVKVVDTSGGSGHVSLDLAHVCHFEFILFFFINYL